MFNLRNGRLFLSSLIGLFVISSAIQAENLPVSSYARFTNGIGNVVVAEKSAYRDPAAYKNVIKQSISIKDLEQFLSMNTRAYLTKPLKEYRGDYYHIVFSVIGQGGSTPFEQHFVNALPVSTMKPEFLERNELAILAHNFNPELSGIEAERFDCWAGLELRLDSEKYSPLKPRYYPLHYQLELDEVYLTMTPKDMKQLSYKYEFKSLQVYVNVYSVKDGGLVKVQRGTKVVFKEDPYTEKMIAVEEPVEIITQAYRDAELMASGAFTITGF